MGADGSWAPPVHETEVYARPWHEYDRVVDVRLDDAALHPGAPGVPCYGVHTAPPDNKIMNIFYEK